MSQHVNYVLTLQRICKTLHLCVVRNLNLNLNNVKCETTNRKKNCINPMCQNSKPLNVTSSLKNHFVFATLSIHTIQTIKYHYHTFSLFNSKIFKFFFPSYFFSYPNKHHFQVPTHLSTNIKYYLLSFSLFNSKFKFPQTLFFPYS